jgi:hypothetical protein
MCRSSGMTDAHSEGIARAAAPASFMAGEVHLGRRSAAEAGRGSGGQGSAPRCWQPLCRTPSTVRLGEAAVRATVGDERLGDVWLGAGAIPAQLYLQRLEAPFRVGKDPSLVPALL